ncbi:MAG: SIMPL domain-containing protein [Armatimonadota bacterium]
MLRIPALSALVVAGMLGALAQTSTVTVSPPQRTITVTGTAQIQATPTLALVVVAVQTQAETVAAAVAANNAAANRVVQAINNLRIPRLTVRTIDFNVQPIYEQRPPNVPPPATPPRITGYQVINRLEARIPGASSEALSSAVSRVIEAALNAGANRVDSIQFTLEDITAANNRALAEAVGNARSTARAVAQAAGVQIAALQSLTTQPFFQPMPYLARAEMAVSGPPIIAGQLTIQASVTAVYTIR